MHHVNLTPWADANYLRLDCTNGPLTGELQVRGASIEILGSHTFRISNDADTATYWYLQSNVANTIFSCINNPLKFQYGAAGSNIGAQMDASGNWIFNVAVADADFTIKKDDGANAYNYDAGTDLQTFNSNTTFASPFTATFDYKVQFNYNVTMDDNTSWTWYDGATKVAWLQADSGTGFLISGVNEPLVFRTGVNGTTQRLVISAAGDFTFNPSFNDDDFIINKNTAGVAYIYDAGADTHSFNSNVNVTGMVRQTTTWHAYGGFQDENETLDIGVATWTHITNGDNDLWTGTEVDGMSLVDDELVITNAGDYAGTLSITFEGSNAKDYLFRVYNVTQSTPAGYHIGASGAGNNNYTNVCVPLYIEAAAGDTFQMQVYTADGTDADFLNAIFYLSYLHD